MKGQAISRLQPSKLNSACVNYTWMMRRLKNAIEWMMRRLKNAIAYFACVNYTWMMRRLKNAIAVPYSYHQLLVVTWSDMAALLMKIWTGLHRILQIGKSIDNKGKWLNKYINMSYFSWITSFIVFMMDFTNSDRISMMMRKKNMIKVSCQCQSVTHFRIKGACNEYFFGNLLIRTFQKLIKFGCSD